MIVWHLFNKLAHIIWAAPTMHEDVVIAQVEPDFEIIQPSIIYDTSFPLLRPSHRIDMRDRIFYTGFQGATRIIFKGICNVVMVCYVSAKNKADLAVGLLLLRIHNALTVGIEDKVFDRMRAFNDIVRVFASRDANPRNLRVGQQCLAHALSHIINGDGVGLILRYAVFSGRAKSEDVPVKQINFNPAILRVLEYPLPMRDFFFDGDLFHQLQGARLVKIHILPLVFIVRINIHADAINIVQRHFGIVLQLNDGRIWMGCPQAQHIVAIAREVVEIGLPEFKVPDRFNIVLCRIARVVVGRGARIQWNIKFDPALFHKGGAFLILNRQTEAQ